MYDIDKYAAIRVSLASAETIRSWAHKMNPNDPNSDTYEVLNGNTINYRTQKPDEDGLFCEKIFGPTKNYECKCGHLKGRQYAGTVCPVCGVEIAPKEVRRERMSYIKLAEPIVHIWYLKGTPSRISEVLDVPSKQVEEVVLLTSHIVLDKGTCDCFENRDVYDEQTAKAKFTDALHNAINKGLIAPGSEDEENANYYLEVLESEPYLDFSGISRLLTKIYGCKFGDGARALQTLLREIDINKEYDSCLAKLKACGPKQSQQIDKLKKRLDVLKAFIDSGNKPEDMILTCLPVIPPDLRPMVPLDGSRFASTDLNDLYQKILRRNNSLKALQDKNAPRQMLVNNIRALQDAVNALIDNGRSGKPILSKNGNRVLKSLSASLKGKQGRFRQNLLGKRVDFSGRSVIAVGPDLKMDECGIPREMAVQLFKPFIAYKLVEKGVCKNAKQAESLIVQQVKEMWPCLDEVIKEHPVLLNRAPTLHRLGIQAFHPKLVEGRAIRLFPLATTAFNADFDGDMMGVHVPLSNEAIWECENLMLGSMNILGPKDGTSIVTPTKDMVLGNYYLTLEETAEDYKKQIAEAKKWNDNAKIEKLEQYIKAEGKVFGDKDEAIKAYQTGQIHLHNRIAVKGKGVHNSTFTDAQNESYLMTTVGKLIFNDIFVDGYPYLNDYVKDDQEMYKGGTSDSFFAPKGSNVKEMIINSPKRNPFVKKTLTNIIDSYIKQYGVEATSEMLNKLKDQGFKYATDSAVTISLFDIVSIDEKEELLKEADEKVNKYKEQFEDGILTDSERHKKVVDLWQATNDTLKSKIYNKFMDDPTNSFSVMAASGAGGNKDQLNQLAGMKGNMNKPNGDVIELPIKSSCRDGLSSFEFFISTHGTRKGGSDTALKTAKSGYLTRRLVDVAQSIVVKEEDCGTHKGLVVSDIIETTDGKVIEPLKDRIKGRFLNAPVCDPVTGEVLFERNHLVSEKDADLIVSKGIKEVEIRSLFTCGCKDGVCQKCYGVDLTNGKEVAMGAAVGIIAAQSIGEPGTQLTMRNFNTGGVAGSKDITQGLPRVEELLEDRQPLGEAVISGYNGVIEDIKSNGDNYDVTIKYSEVEKGKQVFKTETYSGNKLARYVDKNGKLTDPIRDIKKGDTVISGQKLIEGPIYPKDLARLAGKEKAEQYILKEILKVYRSQDIFISDKHLEIMIKQMFKNVKIIDPAMTNLVRGEKITVAEYERIVAEEIAKKNPLPTAFQFVQGITKAALNVESFLSAASFQETTRVLTDAVIKGKTDTLKGIKENVIIGKLIPAGTGLNPDRRFATSEDEKRRL